MSLLPSAEFHTTVAQLRQLPREGIPEVAFVGRSNAGKSTAINVLCNRKRLAFASRTPGRTQSLNYFSLHSGGVLAGFLVDTPGYGYAQAPKALKQEWDTLAGRYLNAREALQGVVLVLDSRREVTALDEALIQWVGPTVPILALATKSDKLTGNEFRRTRVVITATLAKICPDRVHHLVMFSSLDRRGVEDARTIIENWVTGA